MFESTQPSPPLILNAKRSSCQLGKDALESRTSVPAVHAVCARTLGFPLPPVGRAMRLKPSWCSRGMQRGQFENSCQAIPIF